MDIDGSFVYKREVLDKCDPSINRWWDKVEEIRRQMRNSDQELYDMEHVLVDIEKMKERGMNGELLKEEERVTKRMVEIIRFQHRYAVYEAERLTGIKEQDMLDRANECLWRMNLVDEHGKPVKGFVVWRYSKI